MQEFNYEKSAFKHFIFFGSVLAFGATAIFYNVISKYDCEDLAGNLTPCKEPFSSYAFESSLLFFGFLIPFIISFSYLKFINFKMGKKTLYNLFIMPFGEVMIAILLYFLLNKGAMIYEFAEIFALLSLLTLVISVFQIIFAKFAFKGASWS